jgi:hypothetical protein
MHPILPDALTSMPVVFLSRANLKITCPIPDTGQATPIHFTGGSLR